MTELKKENAELKLKNYQLGQFCEASVEGFDTLNNKIAELEREKNNVWDRNTQLKFDMEKLEKKVARQQETITEQRKDIVRLRAKA